MKYLSYLKILNEQHEQKGIDGKTIEPALAHKQIQHEISDLRFIFYIFAHKKNGGG